MPPFPTVRADDPAPYAAPSPAPNAPVGATAPIPWSAARLRLVLMLPVALVAAAVGVLFLVQLHGDLEWEVGERLDATRAALGELLPGRPTQAAHTLGAAADTLARDPDLPAMLAAGDRAGLLARVGPVLQELRRRHGITELSLAGTDQVVLARAHEPGHLGDQLGHITAARAAETGRDAFGLEAGPPGVLMLRYVAPVRPAGDPKGAPVGYVELAMVPDGAVPLVEAAAGARVAVLLHKAAVDRRAWEAHERARGAEPDWDTAGDLVPYTTGRGPLPEGLAGALEAAAGGGHGPVTLSLEGGRLRAVSVSLEDVAGRHLGHVLGIVDDAARLAAMRRMGRRGIAAGLVAVGLVLALLHAAAGRIARRLAEDARRMAEMATRDALTGLFNHRAFYRLLARELLRTARYEQPVAVLMIDIDRLREVNDRHGHLAGDRVVATVAGVVQGALRRIDAVCRVGGGQMAVILPHTGLAAARRAAERIRDRVGAAPFEIDRDRVARVTVSVGVVAHPPAPADAEALVRAADDALYAAKAAGRDRVVEAPGTTTPV